MTKQYAVNKRVEGSGAGYTPDRIKSMLQSLALNITTPEEARYIIKAVRCHGELLEAVKKLHEEYAHQGKGYWAGTGQAIERLIAKAEGRNA